eukprot:1148860-Pelagomonas_calceolata.AAC.5
MFGMLKACTEVDLSLEVQVSSHGVNQVDAGASSIVQLKSSLCMTGRCLNLLAGLNATETRS